MSKDRGGTKPSRQSPEAATAPTSRRRQVLSSSHSTNSRNDSAKTSQEFTIDPAEKDKPYFRVKIFNR